MANGNGTALGSATSREFYSAKEVAAKLGVNYRTLILWMHNPTRRKQLPPFKKFGTEVRGAKYGFPIKKYNEWMESA